MDKNYHSRNQINLSFPLLSEENDSVNIIKKICREQPRLFYFMIRACGDFEWSKYFYPVE